MIPCVVHEDEHLLVVNKPPGWNTHAPGPWAGEGIYDWLRNREARWTRLAIAHRLDKETSGLLVFPVSAAAKRLTEQFSARRVRKQYLLLTDRVPPKREMHARNSLVRAGERYVARPANPGAEVAETRFRVLSEAEAATIALPNRDLDVSDRRLAVIEAEPLTGRTHQIRVQAASLGFPVLGDVLYGGTPAARVFLHATMIGFIHPGTGAPTTFQALPAFDSDPRQQLRTALIDREETDCWRVVHGASDGWPGWYVDRLGEFLLSQSADPLDARRAAALEAMARSSGATGVYHKLLSRQVRRLRAAETSPGCVLGAPAPGPFVVKENRVRYELSFDEGYSVGLFLDQRDNRRRVLTGHLGREMSLPATPGGNRGEASSAGRSSHALLNTFAYTGGFSVCGARAGWRVTTLDLSRKYLEWARRNFRLNGCDATGEAHDFIYGDAFDWLRRLARKQRMFDLALLDPPTFSQSKASGVFRVERDYDRLVRAAVEVLRPGGFLFASCNAAGWPPEAFAEVVRSSAREAGRPAEAELYVPQPPDFPVSRGEPAHLKTIWLRLS